MFPGAHVLLEVTLRTAVIYVVVLAGVRLSGKREVGQMTPFDLTLLLLISNAAQNAMTGPDTSLLGGVVAAATLLVLNYFVAEVSGGNRRFRKFVEGQPSLLVRDGRVISSHMAREHVAWMNCIAPCASTALPAAATSRWPFWKWMARSAA